MAFTGNFMATSFKQEILQGVHNFTTGTGNTFKLALYDTPSTSGTTALTDFDDITFTSATITARGALIYNDTAAGDPAVVVLDFGSDKASTAGDFQIVFPAADASNAIIRIA
jgi:hypothetical protein